MCLQTSIWASRLGLGPLASRLGYGPRGGGDGEEGEGEGEEGEISPICESIGHRPLRGRCPKTEDNRFLINGLAPGPEEGEGEGEEGD